ncbi:uncharacterized protein BKCO1_2400043 [Diplodia corticola]|uniref:Uncharacterized protein n=1 Tax=Diplodia corticola TaxID=236234 RepID=A0A1J9R110_9PEZI|nr:uncharacterized protein BKCO1_2400043 [Diplodia corticola]OJD34320.1 hypothetical protein BKCO1_2400043 [Diplodia corticola]
MIRPILRPILRRSDGSEGRIQGRPLETVPENAPLETVPEDAPLEIAPEDDPPEDFPEDDEDAENLGNPLPEYAEGSSHAGDSAYRGSDDERITISVSTYEKV